MSMKSERQIPNFVYKLSFNEVIFILKKPSSMRSETEIKELVNFFKDNKFFQELEKQNETLDFNKLIPDSGKIQWDLSF